MWMWGDMSLWNVQGPLLHSGDHILTVDYTFNGSYIEVYSGIEFPKHDFQFNYDTKCRVYVSILHHSGLSYKMF